MSLKTATVTGAQAPGHQAATKDITITIPAGVDGRITVGLHLHDAALFDATCAAHDATNMRHGGGTQSCPHTYRSADLVVNGQRMAIYHSDTYTETTIDVTVAA